MIQQQCGIVDVAGDDAMGSSGIGHEIGYADGAEGLTRPDERRFDEGKFDEGKFDESTLARLDEMRLDDPTTGVLG